MTHTHEVASDVTDVLKNKREEKNILHETSATEQQHIVERTQEVMTSLEEMTSQDSATGGWADEQHQQQHNNGDDSIAL